MTAPDPSPPGPGDEHLPGPEVDRPADPGRRRALTRLASAPEGTRFTVRYDLDSPDPSGARFTDAVGLLQPRDPADPAAVVLQTRTGRVRIPLAAVRLAREVPPAAPRRRPRGAPGR